VSGVRHGSVDGADNEPRQFVVSVKDDGVDRSTKAAFAVAEGGCTPGHVELLFKTRLVEDALSAAESVQHVSDGVCERLTGVGLRAEGHHGRRSSGVLVCLRRLHVAEHRLFHHTVFEAESRYDGLKETIPGLNGLANIDYAGGEADIGGAVLVVVKSNGKWCVTGKSPDTVESGCPFSHDVEINSTNGIDDVHKKLVLVPVSVLKCIDSEEGIVGSEICSHNRRSEE